MAGFLWGCRKTVSLGLCGGFGICDDGIWGGGSG